MRDEIAEVTLNPETKQIFDIVFLRKDFRFKCKRCAVFCCRLGGPKVTEQDLIRLKQRGFKPVDFLDFTADEETTQKWGKEPALKKREGGSCIFLQYDGEGRRFTCSVYELRPALCRLYPFEFERTSPDSGLLKYIPCCSGLNAQDGLLIDRKFVEEQMLEAILDLFLNTFPSC